MMSRILSHDTEPMGRLDIPLAPRLTFSAATTASARSDNGLGKTFLLDLVWWALTEISSRYSAMPRRANGAAPSIRCEFDEPPSDGASQAAQPKEAQSTSTSRAGRAG